MPNVKATLKHGIKVGDTVHREIEVREQTCADLEQAQELADGKGGVAINIAMLSLCIVSIGDQKGPFAPELIKRARRSDYLTMVNAMDEAEGEGKPVSSGVQSF